MLVINDKLQIPLRELGFSFARSSGPGGQNVNKVNSKATLRWDVSRSAALPETVRERFLTAYRNRITSEGELVLSSQRFRDQGRNVADCLSKLREMVVRVADEPKKRRPRKVSLAAKRRRLEDKRRQSIKKQGRKLSLRD